MSSDIWTRCGGESELRPLHVEPWRVVEAQHLLSTRKLVDSDVEQVLLEELIEGVKPPALRDAPKSLHYLLLTPFRYPPLRYGSRFGHAVEPGIWYGSEALHTALAESAYYRLVFIEGSATDLGTLRTKLTAYRVRLRSEQAIDLMGSAFEPSAGAISSKTDYHAAQALGSAMRAAGVEAFRYVSARDPAGGANVGAFVPEVFTGAKPKNFENWHCLAEPAGVEFRKLDYFRRVVVRFDRPVFLVDGDLPAPAP